MITLIAACAPDTSGRLVIGRNNSLPWHLPEDLEWFRMQTLGRTIVMGRKTLESIPGGPLPKRHTYVLTRNPEWTHPDVDVIRDHLTLVDAYAESDTFLYVCGGSEVYQLFYPYASSILLTYIEHTVSGDAFFPIDIQTIQNDFELMAADRESKAVSPEKWAGKTELHWEHRCYTKRPVS
jgi:dihydrofolate reductase